ncbi:MULTISPECIES: DUF3182 family protein [unclassified Acidovorax]|uniref:DUF3182 family protein n=1 Tax=unclassified Acidovorax TaxID=2684926 RepID=UPI00070986A2|nr:biotin carboxylase [Acidovorax sp. Root267]KRD46669.1 biotin carboxylase [Acidovorax sp. Root275]MBV7460322.1 DUF3182 family protein [Acidovorax sp. sif0632]MBV7465347.1 DUF3182 family protein [Acidovorax sp. sif0613]
MFEKAARSHLPVARQDIRGTREVVMPFTRGLAGHTSHHEIATRAEVARRIAHMKGCGVSDELPQALWPARTYLIPSETVVGLELAKSIGLHGEDDLFGGVVPHAFIASKAITHPLVSPNSKRPEGWNPQFHELVRDAVLPGYTAFSRSDATEAVRELLALGPVRLKPVAETGGHGQVVVKGLKELNACLSQTPVQALRGPGLVLEHNLSAVETLSVGQVRVAGILASYYGKQHLTENNAGVVTYGGSDLTVVRGDFGDLLKTLAPGAERIAVEQALTYDEAVRGCFPGFFSSRINYDVAQGPNAMGQWCSGVLEQSWRMGGATGAEIAALEAFHEDPSLMLVHTKCVEIFGPLVPLPDGAVKYFQGEDPEAGFLTKYALVENR